MKKIMVLFMISFTILTATTIYEIQTGDVSVGESVTVQGIVTAANGETPDVDQDGNESFYIQDGTGMYNGINVISSDEVSRGDL